MQNKYIALKVKHKLACLFHIRQIGVGNFVDDMGRLHMKKKHTGDQL